MQRILNNDRCEKWLRKPLLSGPYQHWLTDPQSLTLRLKLRYPDFHVTPLMITYAKANQDEIARLQIKSHVHALIRNVFLNGHQKPVVFAHSVLPKNVLRGQWLGLKRLGAKPLGASLFANPKVKRTHMHYKKIGKNHPLFNMMQAYFPSMPFTLWARRSIFNYRCASIMVTEVFLPTILE